MYRPFVRVYVSLREEAPAVVVPKRRARFLATNHDAQPSPALMRDADFDAGRCFVARRHIRNSEECGVPRGGDCCADKGPQMLSAAGTSSRYCPPWLSLGQ